MCAYDVHWQGNFVTISEAPMSAPSWKPTRVGRYGRSYDRRVAKETSHCAGVMVSPGGG